MKPLLISSFARMFLGAVAIAAPAVLMADSYPITDFTESSADLGWYVVNDNVMGGRSDGSFSVASGELRFSGRTNTRGGGFSSIRTGALSLDLSSHDGIRLRIRGDGRRYTWRLSTNARIYGRPIAYWADFETADGEWQTVDVPFERFVPQFRGARLDGPPLDTSQVSGMGLMIYDKRDGPFELKLAGIDAYAAETAFSLDGLRWQKRVLVVSADSEDDAHLTQQLQSIATAPAEFRDRDLALVILLGSGQSSADGVVLTASEADAVRRQFAISTRSFSIALIGKDGTVKRSSDEPIAMAELFALIDSMPMRRREMEKP